MPWKYRPSSVFDQNKTSISPIQQMLATNLCRYEYRGLLYHARLFWIVDHSRTISKLLFGKRSEQTDVVTRRRDLRHTLIKCSSPRFPSPIGSLSKKTGICIAALVDVTVLPCRFQGKANLFNTLCRNPIYPPPKPPPELAAEFPGQSTRPYKTLWRHA